MAENCSHNMHNLIPIRGAQVRDSLAWSKYIDEAIDLFADDTDADVRLAPLAALGSTTTCAGFLASSATCTATSTTRRCAGQPRPTLHSGWS